MVNNPQEEYSTRLKISRPFLIMLVLRGGVIRNHHTHKKKTINSSIFTKVDIFDCSTSTLPLKMNIFDPINSYSYVPP